MKLPHTTEQLATMFEREELIERLVCQKVSNLRMAVRAGHGNLPKLPDNSTDVDMDDAIFKQVFDELLGLVPANPSLESIKSLGTEAKPRPVNETLTRRFDVGVFHDQVTLEETTNDVINQVVTKIYQIVSELGIVPAYVMGDDNKALIDMLVKLKHVGAIVFEFRYTVTEHAVMWDPATALDILEVLNKPELSERPQLVPGEIKTFELPIYRVSKDRGVNIGMTILNLIKTLGGLLPKSTFRNPSFVLTEGMKATIISMYGVYSVKSLRFSLAYELRDSIPFYTDDSLKITGIKFYEDQSI